MKMLLYVKYDIQNNKGRLPQKKRENVGTFPKLGNTMLVKKKIMIYIFGFQSNVHFLGGIMVGRSGKINLKWSNWIDNTSPLL